MLLIQFDIIDIKEKKVISISGVDISVVWVSRTSRISVLDINFSICNCPVNKEVQQPEEKNLISCCDLQNKCFL